MGCYSVLKKPKKMSSVSNENFKEGSLNFNLSIASVKLNYDGDIFSLLNKLKFNKSNIFTKLLIMEQKIINN